MLALIRPVELEDLPRLLDIYAFYVEETAVSFEYTPPTLEEFKERFLSIQSFYPYLLIEEEGYILGYAYASTFKERAAYDWSVETTIYLAKEAKGRGLGRQLYSYLEEALIQMGILNANACIASTAQEDPYLTNASQAFHQSMGYQLVGTFHQSGYKFNHWYDMVWMEKHLGFHQPNMKTPKAFDPNLFAKDYK